MEERLRFVHDAMRDRFTMSELCARYGVSRRTGYKWLARFETEGRRGLADRSRAPHHCPHTVPPSIVELLITERVAHPQWGARKLLKVLATRHPRIRMWPAASTAADLLARRGLVQHRRRRRAPVHPGVIRPVTAAPNDLWTADFKGQFRTGDRQYCYPLTIADQHTRFLLTCRGLHRARVLALNPFRFTRYLERTVLVRMRRSSLESDRSIVEEKHASRVIQMHAFHISNSVRY